MGRVDVLYCHGRSSDISGSSESCDGPEHAFRAEDRSRARMGTPCLRLIVPSERVRQPGGSSMWGAESRDFSPCTPPLVDSRVIAVASTSVERGGADHRIERVC